MLANSPSSWQHDRDHTPSVSPDHEYLIDQIPTCIWCGSFRLGADMVANAGAGGHEGSPFDQATARSALVRRGVAIQKHMPGMRHSGLKELPKSFFSKMMIMQHLFNCILFHLGETASMVDLDKV